MNLKGKFFIFALLLLVLLTVSAVSANENSTDIVSTDENSDEVISVQADDDLLQKGSYNAKIIASDYSGYYGSSKVLKVNVKDSKGKNLKSVFATVTYSDGSEDYEQSNSAGNMYFHPGLYPGNYKAKIKLDDSEYKAKPVSINLKILKSPVKMSVNKITTKTNKYVTLKATVKDKSGYAVDEGYVTFKINSKNYKVKVNNGVATKKIRFKTAGTYSYTATFTSKNYNTKKASSSVVVKKASTGHYIKKAGYTFKVTNSQYKRIQYVKNHKHDQYLSKYANFKVKTGSYYDGLPVYAVVTTWSGIRRGKYLNYPQVQLVVMYGSSERNWGYLTVHYKI